MQAMESDGSTKRRTKVHLEKEYLTTELTSQEDYQKGKKPVGFDREAFKKDFRMELIRSNETEMEFDMIGVDASIANALRRIMISEVPTVAIEQVYVVNNTSIIQDEVLSHRLGLIPIRVDPRKLQFKGPNENPTDLNTLVFHLKVTCERNPHSSSMTHVDPDQLYRNANVYSRQIVWIPQGHQKELFGNEPPIPVHEDILIAKLRPGQCIDLQLHAEKGIGKDHAKWSPVAVASYRLMPEIELTEPVEGDMAQRLAACFSPGVIETYQDSKDGKIKARVVCPRNDTMSRECFRHPEFADKIRLSRLRDYFIFSIESLGSMSPQDILGESISILKQKCENLKSQLTSMSESND